MSAFAYKAKKGPIEIISGTLSANSRQEAIRLIEEKGCIPIEISEVSEKAVAFKEPARMSPRSLVVPTYAICIFTRQLAGFLKSFVPLLNALELIAAQTANKNLKSILTHVTQDIRDGRRFSDVLEMYGGRAFDARYVGMVRAGESSGSLDDILARLADYLENEEETRGQVRAAMTYPLFVVLVGLGTVFFLFTFCIPRLSTLFGGSFATLPLPTKILMSLNRPECQKAIWAMFLILVGAGISMILMSKKDPRLRDRFFGALPFLGKIRLKADLSRFCSTLAMLIQNGIPVYQAIEITRPVLNNELLKQDLQNAQRRMLGGEMLTLILKESKHFPSFVTQMVSTGEESGRLAESLGEVARFYSRESLRGVKMMTSLIEPIFILALSLVVGFVVAGMMLPIFDMQWLNQ